MEFLNFMLVLLICYLLYRKPEYEKLAFGLLLGSTAFMVITFLISTHGRILPAGNL